MMNEKEYEYLVALSYASEDRHYVDQVFEHLRRHDITVFYDKDSEADRRTSIPGLP